MVLSSRTLGLATIFGSEALDSTHCGGTATGNREWTAGEIPATSGGIHCHYNINDGTYGNSNSDIVKDDEERKSAV